MGSRIVAISDTHNHHRKLQVPDGDILLHAGDLTDKGELDEVREFNDWLGSLPHTYKVVVAGNHDFCLENKKEEAEALLTNCIYLMDEAITLRGINIYGSPWQPWFCDWAFNLQRGPEIREKWDLIPDKVDFLVTHGPPADILDMTDRGEPVGCADLLDAVRRVRPKYHIFGHIHEDYGRLVEGGTEFINASSCNLVYEINNQPIIIDWP